MRVWMARATPRAWLEQGQTDYRHQNAPTHFGPVAFEIVSDADHGSITATVELPSRNPPGTVLLRLRHPQAATIQSVNVNGTAWTRIRAGQGSDRIAGPDRQGDRASGIPLTTET